MYAVTVTFTLVEDAMAAFFPLMQANARTSKKTEPGCLQFDICTDPSAPHQVFLYEIYTNRAAFDLHVASDHFKHFDAAVAKLIASKEVRCFGGVLQ